MKKKIIKKVFRTAGLRISRFDAAQAHYELLYEKYKTYTMVPKEWFIANLELCSQYQELEGAYVECGVWRGGMSAAIAEILKPETDIHLFDSFEGLPKAQEIDGPAAIRWQTNVNDPLYHENCKAEISFAQEAMQLAEKTNVKFYAGWFDKTLPGTLKDPISILRLDADWYESTQICLQHIFPLVRRGGIIILDDYHTWDGCAKAVHDYLSHQHLVSRILQWNNRVAYILKRD